ncbi:MAG: hypothetical protein ACAH12_00575 [Methylophilaceae bacterium]
MKKTYYIDYPQEHVEGQAHTYQCVYCKVVTTKINGSIEGHLPSCEYRLQLEHDGFEKEKNSNAHNYSLSDEVD